MSLNMNFVSKTNTHKIRIVVIESELMLQYIIALLAKNCLSHHTFPRFYFKTSTRFVGHSLIFYDSKNKITLIFEKYIKQRLQNQNSFPFLNAVQFTCLAVMANGRILSSQLQSCEINVDRSCSRPLANLTSILAKGGSSIVSTIFTLWDWMTLLKKLLPVLLLL